MPPDEPAPRYGFGDFVVDARAFRLTRGGHPIHLEPKAFDVLLYLLARPETLVSKDELISAVWDGAAVTDNALTRVIAHLRRSLDDPAEEPRLIETVPRRGYRFLVRPSPLPVDGVEEPAAPPGRRSRSLHTRWVVGVAVTAALALALWAIRRAARDDGPARDRVAPIRTIAVLPLKNLSGDAGQDYLADGLTQAIADGFGQITAVTVISSTSAAAYRNTSLRATEIARHLGADALIEGAVQRQGPLVHVSVGLVDGRSGGRLWTRTYEQPLSDVLAVYSQIAVAAAGEVKLAVDTAAASRLAGQRAIDGEAYDAYLRAMFLIGNGWMTGACPEAESLLLTAVTRAPDFAPPHAALAWCYVFPDRLGRGVQEVGPKARAEAARALALDDRLALAHTVAGLIKWRLEYDAAAGEAELRRGVELDPGAIHVLIPAAEFYLWRGQPERGWALLGRAMQLEPISPDRNAALGFLLLSAGRYPAAIERLRRTREIDPRNVPAQFWLGQAHAYAGDQDAAVRETLQLLDDGLVRERRDAERRRLEDGYARGGWTEFWRRELALAEMEARRPGSVWTAPYARYANAWHRARRHARLSQWESALDDLERAYQERHHMVATMPVDPLFAPLRDHPRFRDLLRRTDALP